jgi:3-deoxy-D-manno-octulosonate 8-phosphate phosphatase (KDO 8-P phosphatase)
MTQTSPEITARANRIRMLVLDVDGVLTDGRLYYGAEGEALKVFNTLDGHGLKLLQQTGVLVAIITGRKSEALVKRAADLKISLIQQGREDKLVALQELLQNTDIELQQIAFMGDDWPDLLVMNLVGLAAAPPNAHPEVLARAHWQSQRRGGEGAVRELCDLLMQAQGTYPPALTHYISTTTAVPRA